jgi:cellulose synthase/poly-beta-1,6-N-acetylglucosamine synthase-like glycosyltransferase
MLTIIYVLIGLVEFYFVFYTFYLFLQVLGALIFKLRYRPFKGQVTEYKRFAIMLPAYKAGEHFLNVVDACLKQDYPKERFRVFMLAQHCTADLVQKVKEKDVIVFEKNFDDVQGNPYLHALNYFVDRIIEFGEQQNEIFDAVLLVDKDNLLKPDFLATLNQRFNQGYVAVQGRRRPFNLDTNAACLDYASEALNDQMLRASKAAFGLSAEISGSGMAFDIHLYKKAISQVDFNSPVHDKTFLIELIKLKTFIFYEPSAILYEEKTESYEGITSQRTRWIGGQYYLWRKYFFKLIFWGITQFRLDPIDYAITLFKIPRALHVLGLGFFFFFSLVLPKLSYFHYATWFLLGLGYALSIIELLIIDGAPFKVFKALFSAPLFVLSILRSAIKGSSKKVEGTFIHTEHKKSVSIDDIEKKEKN